MSEWMWVALGYSITYGGIAAYLAVLGRRWGVLRRRKEEAE